MTKEQERKLELDIQRCVDTMQEFVDGEIGDALSKFGDRTGLNETWLNELTQKFDLKDEDMLKGVEQLRNELSERLTNVEEQLDYYDKLYLELDELVTELEVKQKMQKRRQSRIGNVLD